MFTLILFELNLFLQKNLNDKSITHDIFRIRNNDSVTSGFYCIAFIEYMLARKTLIN